MAARSSPEHVEREGVSRLLVVRGRDGLPESVVADVDLLRLLSR